MVGGEEMPLDDIADLSDNVIGGEVETTKAGSNRVGNTGQ